MGQQKWLILTGWFWFWFALLRAADVYANVAQYISQLLLSNKPPPKFSGLKQEPFIIIIYYYYFIIDVRLAWLISAGLPPMSYACWVTGCLCHCPSLSSRLARAFHMVSWKQVKTFEVWARKQKYHLCCIQLAKENSSGGETDFTS